MDARLVRTSVTIDEAVAILMGWTTGPVIYSSSKQDLTDEEYDLLHSETFSLADELEQGESDCESELLEAQDSGAPKSVIEEKRAAIARHRDQVQEAIAYLCAVKDEINKGDQSALRVDSGLSNSRDTYITLTSLNEWSVDRYDKPIAGSNAQNLTTVAATINEQPRVRRKMRDQEEAILQELARLGHSPKSLPRNEPGKPGAKAAARQALADSPLFEATKSFDKAWEQLRKDGDIADSS